jgi:hypothetical protein
MVIVLTGSSGSGPGPGLLGPQGSSLVTWPRPTFDNVGLDNPGAVVPASSSTVSGKYQVTSSAYKIVDAGIIEIENEDFSKPIEIWNPNAELRLYNCKTSDFGGGGPIGLGPWDYRVKAVNSAFGCALLMESCDFAGAKSAILNLDYIVHTFINKSALHKTGADLIKMERYAGYLKAQQCYFTQLADPYYWPPFNTPGNPGYHVLVDGNGAPLVHGDAFQAPDIYVTLQTAIEAGTVVQIGGPGQYSPLFEFIGCGFDMIAPGHPGALTTDDPSPPLGPDAYGGLNGTIFVQNRAGTPSGSLEFPLFRVIGNWGLGGCANGLQVAAQTPGGGAPAPATSHGFAVENNDFAFEYYNAPADIRGQATYKDNLWSPTGASMDLWLQQGFGWPTN